MMIDFLLTENTGSQLLFSYDIMRKAENLMKTLEFLMISKYFCFQKYCFEFSHHKILTISFFFQFSELDPSQLTFTSKQPPKKKRKSRTAFTNHQIFELEKRFLYQKYLSPADRDEIAAQLGLSNAQVSCIPPQHGAKKRENSTSSS